MAIGIGIGLTFGRRKGIDAQAQAAFNSLQSAGFTTPQGIVGINAAFKTIKTIYGTSDITTAISFFGDPSLAYQIGAGSGTTAGQAIRTLPNIIDPTRATDAVQTTAASQPLLLTHTSGENYWWGSNTNNNCVTTPNAAANQITGNIDIISYVQHISNGALSGLCSKNDNGANRGYSLCFETNTLTLYYGSSSLNTASATATIASGSTLWVRCTRNSSTGDIIFYTSNDAITTNPQSVNWAQLGATISGVAGALASSSANGLIIGGYLNVASPLSRNAGKIYRLTISNSIGGAPVVDFNPNQYNPSTSQTQWTSSTGEVWTINTGTATTGYKGVLVNRTTMQGDGVDDRLTSGTLASRQYFTSYAAQKLYVYNTTDKPIYSGSTDSHILYGNTSIYLFNGAILMSGNTSTLLNASTLDFNNTSSKIRVNAGADVTGAGGTKSSTTINIFSYGGTFGNAILNTLIQSSGINNNTTKTEMYNYIRSINNSAF
jgi:hypothetical protein